MKLRARRQKYRSKLERRFKAFPVRTKNRRRSRLLKRSTHAFNGMRLSRKRQSNRRSFSTRGNAFSAEPTRSFILATAFLSLETNAKKIQAASVGISAFCKPSRPIRNKNEPGSHGWK